MTVRPSASRWTRGTGSLGLYALLFAVTLAAYRPAVRAGFIWNDSDYVTKPALRSWEGLRRIWFEVGATEQYYPFLHSAFWVEHRLWGDAPLGYHLVNILLHATSACLLLVILRYFPPPCSPPSSSRCIRCTWSQWRGSRSRRTRSRRYSTCWRYSHI